MRGVSATMITANLRTSYGVTVTQKRLEFVLYGPELKSVELVLFHADTQEEVARFPANKRVGSDWYWSLSSNYSDLVYLYCVTLQQGEACFISDPYAQQLSHAWYWDKQQYQNNPALWFPKGKIPAFTEAVDAVRPLTKPIQPHHRVVYEAHLKSMSVQHPAVPEAHRGTYLGLCHTSVIEHLQGLGVTTIQLMPLMAFMPEPFIVEKGLTNYWGYNTASFFAPDPRYAFQDAHTELQICVDTFHKAGFEVILDVVFNHTAEGGQDGPILHHRATQPNTAYTFLPESREYANYSGCGNTINLAHQYNLQMILDAARHWVTVYGFDGFRYDLATNMGRQPHAFSLKSGLFKALQQDPILRDKIHIAEPWDIGEYGYQLGNFPVSFAEINDQFRDITRSFWRGESNKMADFATCMFGSRDVFHKGVRASYTSVNGVTFHDGFTLQDVVSYNDKHNDANLEDNRDGHNHNASCNYGVEGPTDDVVINNVRERQKRNLFASMIFAQGTPLVLHGDELSRTQLGNNNAYCQDNELNYCDWDLNRQQADFLAFCQYCIALKQSSQILTNAQLADDTFFAQCNVGAVHWYKIDGSPKADSDWHDPTNKGFAVELIGSSDNQEHWLICVNADKLDHHLVLPKVKKNHRWQVVLDTRMTDFNPLGAYIAKSQFVISNRSFVIFKQTDRTREL